MLLSQLSDASKLQEFVDMIDLCLPTLPVAPPAYASQTSTVVGRPLALTTIGWSLELASERLESQVLPVPTAAPPRVLADPDTRNRKLDPNDPTRQRFDPSYYSFQVKFGSGEKQYDGLVGYFAGSKQPLNKQALASNALDLSTLYTYYRDDSSKWTVPTEQNKSMLFPFYLDPTNDKPENLFQLRCQEQTVLGVIMDPFASVHAYTGILPIKDIRLPQWTIQGAFSRMTTLFNIGPLLLTTPLLAGDDKTQVAVGEATTAHADTDLNIAVAIPTQTLGTWNWLQPYSRTVTTNGHTAEESFSNVMKIDKTQATGFKFESTPYTATEGYLQLRGPQQQVESS